jgi:hypothetical protein
MQRNVLQRRSRQKRQLPWGRNAPGSRFRFLSSARRSESEYGGTAGLVFLRQMFWDVLRWKSGRTSPDNKPLPGGGQHRAQGFHFVLQHDVPSTVGQPGWSFCDKCNGMFFVGNPGEPPLTTSHCPAGGQHRAQGFHFVLPHREFPNPKIRIVVPPDRRSFAVEGRGFELGQPVKITHHRKSGSTLSEGIDQISSDSAGRFLFQVDFGGSIIDSGSALAFDFGSGETAKDSFG